MNKSIRFLTTIIIYLACIQSCAFIAGEKSDVIYRIERAWFDSEYVYILYNENSATESYSIVNIHGTVTDETNKLFISRFARDALLDGSLIDLGAGEPADSLVYLDQDFYISANDKPAEFFNQSRQITSNQCTSTFWPAVAAIRSYGKLFYCGSIINHSGNVEIELPASIAEAIDKGFDFEPSIDSATMPTQTISAVTDKGVIVVRRQPYKRISELKLATQYLEMLGELSWTTIPLQKTRNGFDINNSVKVYSPTKIVLSSYSDYGAGILLCDQHGCKLVEIDSAWSYLLVDGDRNSIMTLTLDNMTVPRVAVHILGF